MLHTLRIALISEHASPLATIGSVDAGGQNIYVANVANCLARAGHHVDVFTRRDGIALPPCVHTAARSRVFHVNAGPACFVPKEKLLGYMPAFARSLQDLFKQAPPYDVVHANFFMSGQIGLTLRSIFKVPMVMTFHALGLVRREHQGAADGFPAARIAIERRIVRHADRIIAECPQDADDLMRLYKAKPHMISTVPCGVDLDEFAPANKGDARRQLGLADDEFIVLQLGRMVPRKGVDNVVRAMALMDRAVRPRLVVAGGESEQPDEAFTPEIGRLRHVAHECGVADRVTFVGRRERQQLRSFYAAADVFATTPWYEPFGITPLEAMACARPVVGSNVGGIKHTVVDGVTGYLVPPRDPQALAERLCLLQKNPSIRAEMGLAGLQRARSRFTWEQVAQQLADVYAAVCDQARRPRRRTLSAHVDAGRVQTAGVGA